MPLILGTNSIKDTGYDVANSLMFSSDHYLTKSFSSAGNRQSWTWSAWIKRSKQYNGTNTNANRQVWFGGYTASNDTQWLEFGTQGDIFYYTTNSLSATGTRLMRDLSAWFHAVVVYNGSNIKFYHNNVLDCTLSLSGDRGINVGGTHTIGALATNQSSRRFEGYMTEVCFIDGSQLDPDQFGEFDEDSPTIWKPKDVSGLTFGTNGFYLDFEDSSALGNDVSGNNNDFTANNISATDQSTDTCTNNFATFNNLLGSNRQGSQLTFSEGNCKVQDSGGSNDPYIPSTIGVTKGKWYAELKLDAYTEDGHAFGIAATDGDFSESTSNLFCVLQYATKAGDNLPRIYNFGDVSVDDQADNDPGDIIGCAVDIDNGTVDFTVNGSAYASQVTGLSSNFSGKTIFFIIRGEGGASRTFTSSVNFGSPSFSISSGNSDANGYGNFEYSVPSGYYSLNSKNLSEFG